jgi:methionyl-tRNA synthetase
LNRTVSMAHKFVGATLPARRLDPTHSMPAVASYEEIGRAWEAFAPQKALELIWQVIRFGNGLIDRRAPWKLVKEANGKAEVEGVLADVCQLIRVSALFLAPAMPSVAREILRQLGRSEDEGTWPTESSVVHWPGGTLTEPKPVFPRIEPERQAALIAMWMPAPVEAPAAPAPTAEAAKPPAADIAYEDFQKLELRAARVTAAERVPKADKLLKLTLDVGGDPQETRTVVSGIAPAYAPEQMVGKTVIYLANLAPRKIRGVLSQGMILAAGADDVLALSGLDRDVPPGTPIR